MQGDDYVAYCIDEAVAHFGNVIKNELDGIEAKSPKQTEAKRTNYLRKRLGLRVSYRSAPASSTAPGRKAVNG